MPLSKINSAAIANSAVVAADIADASITAAKIVSIANTQITGNIISSQITSVAGSQITANTIANSAFQTGAVENYMNAAGLGFGMRNRIINGAMVIDQRNAGASVTANSGVYPVDRFQTYATQSSKLTCQQSTTVPSNFKNSVLYTSSSAYTVSAGDYFSFTQRIEGFNVADFGFGTATASTVTLSFWVRSSLTGTFGGACHNNAFNRVYPFSYTISSANTWEQKTVTIAGDTTGTWTTDNSVGLEIGFSLGCGSTGLGTAGAWAGTSNIFGVTGQVNVVGTNGATFYITGVQLEKGSTATSFDYRPYGTELALCQRYYEVAGAGAAGKTNSANNTGDHGVCLSYKVAKRTTPTLSITSGTNALVIPQVNTYSISNITGANGTVNGAYFNLTTTASVGAANVPLIGYNDAWLAVSAEL